MHHSTRRSGFLAIGEKPFDIRSRCIYTISRYIWQIKGDPLTSGGNDE